MLDAEDLDHDLLDDLMNCGAGDATNAVNHVRNHYQITGNPVDCIKYLEQYGAWDDDELTDHESNIDRLVWLTGGAFADGEECAYFSTY